MKTRKHQPKRRGTNRTLRLEQLQTRELMAADAFDMGSGFTNPVNPLDVDASGFVDATDTKAVTRALDEYGSMKLGARSSHDLLPWVDVNGDGHLSPMDALLIVNRLEESRANVKRLGEIAAHDDSFLVQQNSGEQTLDVLANDTLVRDVDDVVEITDVSSGSAGGRLSVSADGGTVLYAPPADFAGEVTFTYYIGEHSAEVTVQVAAPLKDDSYQFVADGRPQTLNLLDNDPFWEGYAGDKHVTIVSETSAGGSVVISDDGSSVQYTMPDGYHGSDSFVYIVDDRYAGRVTIDIPAPLQRDQFDIIQDDELAHFDVLANDPLWDGYEGERRITHVFDVSDGATAVISDDGRSVIYSPPKDFYGWESFKYVVDGRLDATANFNVHRPVSNDYSKVEQNSTAVFINLLDNDWFSVDDDRQDVVGQITWVGESDHRSTIAVAPDGQGVLYTPPDGFTGVDVFEYLADGKYRASASIEVVQRDSIELHFDSIEVVEGSGSNLLAILDNDYFGSEYEGDGVITGLKSESFSGSIAGIAISPDGRSLLYNAAPGLTDSKFFSYTVDGKHAASVYISVRPRLEADRFEFSVPEIRELDVLRNDTRLSEDYAGPGLITSVSQPSGGGLVQILDGGRKLSLSPGNGSDSFSYTVDGKYTASVDISYANRLEWDSVVVDQNSPEAVIDVLANDFQSKQLVDKWGEYAGPKQITAVSETVSGGKVTIASGGKAILYSPPADYVGSDSFSYTVDGFQTTTVRLDVIRHVRDDTFHVLPNSSNNSLKVLVNDLFAANYSGRQRVTEVSETTAGGSVQVSADGKSVVYTPAGSFQGEDSFTYTVDGGLKASVTVVVNDAAGDLPKYGDGEFKSQLIADALERYEDLFGSEYFRWLDWTGDVIIRHTSIDDSSRHSETNVQVQGVDEADIVENDGKFLYTLTDGHLTITKASPAEDLKVVSRVKIEGQLLGEYLREDRLAVISRDNGSVTVTLLDVSDRSQPVLVQRMVLDGRYVESRRIDGAVFLILENSPQLPSPKYTCDEAGDGCVYESRDEYLERIEREFETYVPQFRSYGPEKSDQISGAIVDEHNIYKQTNASLGSLLSIVSVDLASEELGFKAVTNLAQGIDSQSSRSILMSDQLSGIIESVQITLPIAAPWNNAASTSKAFATKDSLYVFQTQSDSLGEDRDRTSILKFAWNSTNGTVRPVASGGVAGRMLNQFSADEYDGRLRIMTTIQNANRSGRSENALFVLRQDAGVLEFDASLRNIAQGESLKSVRFFGERVFAVTYRDVDPLFAIDLSDQRSPKVVGHLTLPGFSSYMQFVGARSFANRGY